METIVGLVGNCWSNDRMVYRFIIKITIYILLTRLKNALVILKMMYWVCKQVDFSNNLTSKLLSRRKNHEFKKSGNA